ncbi:YrzE family protein [Arthrobacter castelli]|uniref:YrzE family protein n=1 Tax=Arthrobacter castelli TaxID=271431 RepID=UPI00040FB829|nr:YrzE family protein [Arthrobacter castelli]
MSSSYTPGRDSGDPNDPAHRGGGTGDTSGRRPVESEPIDDQNDAGDPGDTRTRPFNTRDVSADDDTRTRPFNTRDVSAHRGNGESIQGERSAGASHRLDPDGGADAAPVGAAGGVVSREGKLEREKDAYGGIKFGSAFFGWLAATGMTVLLTALAAAITAAVGAATNTQTDQVVQNPQAAGIWGIVIVLVVLFIAYYCGGFVAGRMARFDGARQGFAVWLWAIVIAIIVTLVGAIVGSQMGGLSSFTSLPQMNVDQSMMTMAGILTLIGLILVTLGGAILGGLAGMRFHRKVDRAGFDFG